MSTTKELTERITTMAAPHSADPAPLLEQHLADTSPDLLRQMIATFANAMMSAQADQVCGASYGERSETRTNRRNGYRTREWYTRAGTIELAIPRPGEARSPRTVRMIDESEPVASDSFPDGPVRCLQPDPSAGSGSLSQRPPRARCTVCDVGLVLGRLTGWVGLAVLSVGTMRGGQ